MGRGNINFVKNGLGNMTKMASKPIYGQNLKKSLVSSYDIETWHAVLEPQARQGLYNDDPRLTLTYFTTRSNLVVNAFEWGPRSSMIF